MSVSQVFTDRHYNPVCAPFFCDRGPQSAQVLQCESRGRCRGAFSMLFVPLVLVNLCPQVQRAINTSDGRAAPQLRNSPLTNIVISCSAMSPSAPLLVHAYTSTPYTHVLACSPLHAPAEPIQLALLQGMGCGKAATGAGNG